jgi:hypothetical protein
MIGSVFASLIGKPGLKCLNRGETSHPTSHNLSLLPAGGLPPASGDGFVENWNGRSGRSVGGVAGVARSGYLTVTSVNQTRKLSGPTWFRERLRPPMS